LDFGLLKLIKNVKMYVCEADGYWIGSAVSEEVHLRATDLSEKWVGKRG
jgi:hypothetical protein